VINQSLCGEASSFWDQSAIHVAPGASQPILKGCLSRVSRPVQKLDIFENETRVPAIAPMRPRLLTVFRLRQFVEVEQLLGRIPSDCLYQQSTGFQNQLRVIIRGEEVAEQQVATLDRKVQPRKPPETIWKRKKTPGSGLWKPRKLTIVGSSFAPLRSTD